MKFADALAHDRRLAMLKLLVEADGIANESVLQTGLEMLGHHVGLTRQAVRDDLKFMEDRGVIRLEWFGDKVAVAHIQRRGVEVAEGRVVVDGIKRPSLGVAMAAQSKIDLLPEDMRADLDRLLRDPKTTIDQVTAYLKEKGADVSRSSIGRYAKTFSEVADRMRETREFATALGREIGDQPDDELAQFTIENLQGAIFRIQMRLERGEEPPEAEDVSLLANATYKLASARKVDADRVIKIKLETARAAATAVGKMAKSEGWSDDTVARVRKEILKVGA